MSRTRSPSEQAANVVLERFAASEDDLFLAICNPEQRSIATEIVRVALHRVRQATLLEFPPTSRDGEEPPLQIAEAMRTATLLVLATTRSLSHTAARVAATRHDARIASMPGITRETFERAVVVDYPRLEQDGRALAARLTSAHRCHLTAPGGTDLTLDLHGRQGWSDDGDLRVPGAWENLPAGEAYIAPVEPGANGTIVFDGTLGGWGIVDEPVTVKVQNGRATEASGGKAAAWLLHTLDAGGANGRQIAELGIGLNPNARLCGHILEDEKVAGTAHIAFGTNTTFGGRSLARVHIDGLIRHPTVELDDEPAYSPITQGITAHVRRSTLSLAIGAISATHGVACSEA